MSPYYGRSNKGSVFIGQSLLAALIIATIFSFYLRECADNKSNAKQVLQQNGYTNITITGNRCEMVNEKETYVTGFEAISPSGAKVSGVVYGDSPKNSTIRFN